MKCPGPRGRIPPGAQQHERAKRSRRSPVDGPVAEPGGEWDEAAAGVAEGGVTRANSGTSVAVRKASAAQAIMKTSSG